MKNFFSILIYVSLISLMACVNDTKPGTAAPVSTEKPSSQAAATEAPAQVQPVQQSQPIQSAQVEKPAARPQSVPAKQAANVQSTTNNKPASNPSGQGAGQSMSQPPAGQALTGKDLSPKTREMVMRKTGLTEAEISNMGPQEIERAVEAYQRKMQASGAVQNPPQKAEPPKNENALPSTCGLVSPEFIGKLIGVPADPIVVKDGSAKNSNYQRACFFKWAYNNVPNSGVMVQLSSNPVPDDLPDWASYYISTKKNNGDKAPDGSATYRYKDFPDVGVAGAYNYDLGRYYFRTEKDHVIGVLFNLQASEAEQLLWATKIGQEVLKNLY